MTRIYQQLKSQLVEYCEKLNSYCVIVDSWTESYTGTGSRHQTGSRKKIDSLSFRLGINYCGIALRYADDDFKLFSFILGCFVYEAPTHSASDFRDFVNKKLQDYNLNLNSSKFVVNDNEPKMLAAFRDQCIRIGCSIHYLNKQLQHAFESSEIHVNKKDIEKFGCETAQDTFSNVKKIVNHVRRSHRQQKLSLKLQVYSETRFNGAMIMLDIFRQVFDELPSILANNKAIDNYNEIDKETLDDICRFLHPFEEVLQTLSEDQRPTLHRVIPLRQCLIKKCVFLEEDSTAVTELKLFLGKID